MPKVQNFVKNAQQQFPSEPKGTNPSLFQNVQVVSNSKGGQGQQSVPSGYIQVSQVSSGGEAGSQITQKKKMQSLQPSQNQMKKNA